jgi:hypothetical protein
VLAAPQDLEDELVAILAVLAQQDVQPLEGMMSNACSRASTSSARKSRVPEGGSNCVGIPLASRKTVPRVTSARRQPGASGPETR